MGRRNGEEWGGEIGKRNGGGGIGRMKGREIGVDSKEGKGGGEVREVILK